jgi:hypothetical protein
MTGIVWVGSARSPHDNVIDREAPAAWGAAAPALANVAEQVEWRKSDARHPGLGSFNRFLCVR